jgi:hypothetical protein
MVGKENPKWLLKACPFHFYKITVTLTYVRSHSLRALWLFHTCVFDAPLNSFPKAPFFFLFNLQYLQ